MSKAVSLDHEFNIDLYCELLNKAKGGRSQTEFAKDCGLSVAYICKHLNKTIKTPPIPSTLVKIAAVAANGVTYEDLLEAAGYDSKNHVFRKDIGQLFEKQATMIITSSLSSSNYDWTIRGGYDLNYDLNVEIAKPTNTHWYFNFIKKFQPFNKHYASGQLDHIYGELVRLPICNNILYSVVTNSSEFYDFIVNNPPTSLAIPFSVILIDTKNLEVIKQEYVKTAATTDLNSLPSV